MRRRDGCRRSHDMYLPTCLFRLSVVYYLLACSNGSRSTETAVTGLDAFSLAPSPRGTRAPAVFGLQRHGRSRAWTDRLRYTPGVRYYHVAYEQLTGAAAENYLRSVVAFVLDKGVDIDLSSLSMASELNMLHEASCRKRVAPSLYALVRKAFGPGSSEPRSVIGACDVLDARVPRGGRSAPMNA